MHLLFARFIARVLNEQGLVPKPEPFDHLLTQGMVLSETFVQRSNGAFLPPSAVHKEGKEWKTESGEAVDLRFEKMSKCKHNGVDPKDVLKRYGSDAVRVGMLMQCPAENAFLFTSRIMDPAMELLRKMDMACSICTEPPLLHKQVKLDVGKLNDQYNKVQHDMKGFSFHTVLSSVNIMLNMLVQAPYSSKFLEYYKTVLLFMKPFAPLKAEECWNRLIQARRIAPEESFAQQLWPKEERQQDMMVIVQINGKMKKTLRADRSVESLSDPSSIVAALEKMEEVRSLLSFQPRDIKVIRKGNRIVLNYLK